MMNQLYVKTRNEWRNWLSEHHDKVPEVWLVFYKKETGQPSIDYGASVEEALCFGWVDSLIKKIDDAKYARKYTPRNDDSVWSESNKKRVAKMIDQGKMTESGQVKIDVAKKNGMWNKKIQRPEIPSEVPPELADALEENRVAKSFFNELAPTYQKQFIMWISTAKRAETKIKRVRESIALLEKREKLGLR
ncbi:hypothetical protein GF337_04080 [candidate division KSB1 bacterium]|nr:hypothetical protein [candidate division KSB1 bacterium]